MTGRPYHTQLVDGEMLVGDWDHSEHNPRFCSISLPGETLLDAGCRDAYFAALFLDRGMKVTACDRAETAEMKKLRDQLGFEFIHSDLFSLPGSKRYDVVWLADVLCHNTDRIGLLRKMRSLCQKKFYLVHDIHPSAPNGTARPSRVTQGEYPYLVSRDFVVGEMLYAGFTQIQIEHTYIMKSPNGTYRNRTVSMFSANPNSK